MAMGSRPAFDIEGTRIAVANAEGGVVRHRGDVHARAVRAGRRGLAQADIDRLRTHLSRLQALYERHIAIEDHEGFPAAARTLAPADIEQIGGEMAARRQVSRRADAGDRE